MENTYFEQGVYNAPFQILHAGDTLYEINAALTERQNEDNTLCHFTRLFDYLLSKKGGFERVVVSMSPDNSMMARLVCMSASYVQVSLCPGGFDITSLLSLLLYTFPEWYDWRSSKRKTNCNVLSSIVPMILPFRIVRYKVRRVRGTLNNHELDSTHARMIRSIEDFVRAYADGTCCSCNYYWA